MSRKLSKQEVENRVISKIIHRIMQLEKIYDARMVERACNRYKNAMASKRQALKHKKRLEDELAQIKRKLR